MSLIDKLTDGYDGARLFLAGNVLLGLNIPLAKFALAGIALGPFLIVRHLLAGAFLMTVAKASGEWRKLSWQELKSIGLLGLIGISLANALLYYGVTIVPSTYVLLIMLTLPVLVYGLSSLILRESLDKQALLGTLISLSGVIFLIVGQFWQDGLVWSRLSGLGILLAAMLSMAYAMIRTKQALVDIEPIQVASLQLMIGSLPFIVWWGTELAGFNWLIINWQYLLAFFMVVLVVTPLGYLLFFKGLKSVNVKSSVGYIYYQTIAGDVLAVAFFAEKLSHLYVISIIIVMIGVWIGRTSFGRVWPEYSHRPLMERLRQLGRIAYHRHGSMIHIFHNDRDLF